MTDYTGLVAFLRARLDEDERIARAALGSRGRRWRIVTSPGGTNLDGTKLAEGRPSIDTSGMGWETANSDEVWSCGDSDDCGTYRWEDMNDAEHIVCHDPARVLAEIEAKRRIIELHKSFALVDADNSEPVTPYGDRYCWTCSDDDTSYWGDRYRREWPCATILALTLPYADHPDYKDEWKPE